MKNDELSVRIQMGDALYEYELVIKTDSSSLRNDYLDLQSQGTKSIFDDELPSKPMALNEAYTHYKFYRHKKFGREFLESDESYKLYSMF